MHAARLAIPIHDMFSFLTAMLEIQGLCKRCGQTKVLVAGVEAVFCYAHDAVWAASRAWLTGSTTLAVLLTCTVVAWGWPRARPAGDFRRELVPGPLPDEVPWPPPPKGGATMWACCPHTGCRVILRDGLILAYASPTNGQR